MVKGYLKNAGCIEKTVSTASENNMAVISHADKNAIFIPLSFVWRF